MSKVGNVIPMRELVDSPAARASGVAPVKAWAMLELARAAGCAGARLTWCAGWTSALRARADATPEETTACPMSGEPTDEPSGIPAVCPGCETKRKPRKSGVWPRHGGNGGREEVDIVTESLALRVPGVLWCAWERPMGEASWKASAGQIRTEGSGGARVAKCTVAGAEKALRATVKTRGQVAGDEGLGADRRAQDRGA